MPDLQSGLSPAETDLSSLEGREAVPVHRWASSSAHVLWRRVPVDPFLAVRMAVLVGVAASDLDLGSPGATRSRSVLPGLRAS